VITPPRSQPAAVRILLTAIAFLIGMIAALIAGILQQASHAPMPQLVEYGCAAFGGTVIFVFSVFSFIGGGRNDSK